VNLWLVRHAQPLVAPGTCYGVLDVLPDADATVLAAQALAATLPQHRAVQVSPLQRCEQLALCLQGLRPDLTFMTDVRLQEMDFGIWEGVAWADIPRSAMDAWTADFGDHCFGGKESANQVLQRIGDAWDAWCATRATGVWITHAGVCRAVQLLLKGQRRVDRADQWPQSAPAFGAWEKVALTGQ